MSDLTYTWDQAVVEETPAGPAQTWVEPSKRSIWQPLLLIIPVLFAAGGYAGTAPLLTDLAFLVLTILCGVFLLAELMRFAERFGIGGLILYGGVLAWFCYDYFRFWFLGWLHHWPGPFTPEVVAKAAMYHMLFVLFMSIGIRFRTGRWLARLITKLPEPNKPADYFVVMIVAQMIGLSGFIFFTSDRLYVTLYNQIVGGRGGNAITHWTVVGRTGNLNYSFGAYVAELLQVGTGAAIVAAFCLVFLRQNIIKNIICALVWLLGLALAFGSGTRGAVVVVMLPMVFFVFIRYHVQAQELLHKYSIRAYIFVACLLFLSVVIFQTQIRFRNQGFEHVSLSSISLSTVEGNEMFTSSLTGFMYVPEQHNFFYDSFPGETIIRPIPNFVIWALIAPMPRAIWTSKPVDPSWKWYNAISTGRSTVGGGTTEGTTISEGIVGYWYFRFGVAGVIEGGLFMGWLMGIVERALFNNGGRPLAFLCALAISAWLFRTYRDADLQDLADAGVTMAGLALCVLGLRPFLGSGVSSAST